ncbi:hypothetical protein IGI39_004239 [Enterococcus sp. AZ135]|uniref:HAD family hydrolase n=1 Tax=unclassified Enterococcus TaxID=2608891 RepID=UPI003F204038
MIMSVIFDIDDTLLDNYSAFVEAVEDVYHERTLSAETLSHLYTCFRQNSEKVYQQFHADVMKDPAKKFERWQIVPQQLGIENERGQLHMLDALYHEYQSKLRLSDTFIELFAELKKNQIHLAVLSNGLQKKQGKKIAQLDLPKYIDKNHLFVSEVLGESKPNLSCYNKVKQLLPKPIERIFYLGDSYVNDVLGSRSAGWTPIWLNRFNERSTVEGILEVKTAEEAAAQIKRVAIQ